MSTAFAIDTQRVAILVPLAVGATVFLSTILVHALAVRVAVTFIRRERRVGRVGTSFWDDVSIVAGAISTAFAAHLTEIALWAAVFMMCGQFADFGAAFDHAAVNYTSLGYGDVVMSPSWRLLGPLAAANGLLMFGVSTAMIFALVQRLLRARFVDLRD